MAEGDRPMDFHAWWMELILGKALQSGSEHFSISKVNIPDLKGLQAR
jgi:hypothetical protein